MALAGALPGVLKAAGFIKRNIHTLPPAPPPPPQEYKGSETEAVREIRLQHPAAHMELLQ